MVKRARPISAAALASSTALKVRRGDVRRAVIVRTKKASRRPDGRMVRFDDNAVVLINAKKEMLGTRIAGPVSAALRTMGWPKVVSLAPKVCTQRLSTYILFVNTPILGCIKEEKPLNQIFSIPTTPGLDLYITS